MPQQENPANRPIHTVRHGRLKAAIWRNPTDKGVLYNVTIVRSYRDRVSGAWHETHSIGYDDLMNVAALMYEAHGYISGLKAKPAQRGKPAPKSP